jgi:hypothetical protein
VDGAEAHTWPEAGPEVFWSADNRTVATTARTEPGRAFVVVVGGTAWPRFDETTPLGFGPDGRSFAARVRHAEQQSVVLDGTARTPYEEIGVGGTRVGFTPAGKVTYLARKPDGAVVWVEESRGDLPDDGGPRLAAGGAKGSDWTPLFIGKDLANWKLPDVSQGNYDRPPPNQVKWAVADGAITFSGKDYSYLETAGQDSRRFHLRLEARTSPGARVQLRLGQRFGQAARVAIDNNGTVVTDHTHAPTRSGNTVIDWFLPAGRIGLKYHGGSNGSPIEFGRVDIRELK